MPSMSLEVMRQFLGTSISSGKKGAGVINRNKLHGLLAEIEFRKHLAACGFGDRVSVGGWIARSVGPDNFAHRTVVLFPHTIAANEEILPGEIQPSYGLHTICATFHQIGIHSHFCVPSVGVTNDSSSISWTAIQLGVPTQQQSKPFPECMTPYFSTRKKRHNFLNNTTDVSPIPDQYLPEEFTKEHFRVAFNTPFLAEISDVDGILWGQQFTYPIEIKEKTVVPDKGKLGPWFGLDLGPFVKLAFYAAKRGNLHSLFVVHEIDNVEDRNHVEWWYITFERMAQYASWNSSAGGQAMTGGSSTVVRIPKAEFSRLTKAELEKL